MDGRTLKRKLASPLAALSRKKAKRHPGEICLKVSSTSAHASEVEGVEVVYDDRKDGHVVKFKRKDPQNTVDAVDEVPSKADAPQVATSIPIVLEYFDSSLLPSWAPYPLHPALMQSIHRRIFEVPTEIQKRTLDPFLKGPSSELQEGDRKMDGVEDVQDVSGPKRRDIVGIAQTGSGKTLAYGLPILHDLLTSLSTPSPSTDKARSLTITPPPSVQRRSLRALILAPTRELALQVSEHLNACLDQLFSAQSRPKDEEHLKTEGKSPPPVSVAAIVGGMSAQKQRLILSRGVDVLVATPGRFWDLCGEDPALTAQLRSLRFLVLDEADRMVEAGHFQELDNILQLTSRPSADMDTGLPSEDPPRPEDLAYADAEVYQRNNELQTFVFSATMSKYLQRDLNKRKRGGGNRKQVDASTLDDLLMKLDFRDLDPVIIDLSPEGGRVESLQESKIECLTNDKDSYLYYFLLRHPVRSLVFLSSIDGIRRLMPLLELPKVNAWPLHSGLQQKQRLKNLDRLKPTTNAVLLATDVAARGLDVPAVDHVIHYQVPRSADAYVHRNGRTARAKRKASGSYFVPQTNGASFAVYCPLSGGDDVPELSVEHHFIDKLKAQVQIAQKIDSLTHRTKKETHDRNWMRETAEATEIELPSDLESDCSDNIPVSYIKKARDGKLAGLKMELKQALAQPLVARGVSTRYITSGSRAVVDDVLEGTHHETLLGLKRLEAGNEAVRTKKKKRKKRDD